MPYTCVPTVFWTVHSVSSEETTNRAYTLDAVLQEFVRFWSSVCTRDADIMMQ